MLFGLEELDTFAFSNECDVMWRGFVTSAIAAMALQYVDPFGTAKLVLFEVSAVIDTWRAFELVSRLSWFTESVAKGARTDSLVAVSCHWGKLFEPAPPGFDL